VNLIGIWTYYCYSLCAAALLHQGEILRCICEINSTVVDGARGTECALHLHMTLLHVLEVSDVTVLSYALKLTERICSDFCKCWTLKTLLC